MPSENEQSRRRLGQIETLIHGVDEEDLRPQYMWQIYACGPIHSNSIPPFLIDLTVEMDRHNRKYAYRTRHCPPKFSHERILTRAAHIMLLDYIERHYGSLDKEAVALDKAVEAVENNQKGVMPRSQAIRHAINEAPPKIKKYVNDEFYLAKKFKKNTDHYLIHASDRIFDEEFPVTRVLPLY